MILAHELHEPAVHAQHRAHVDLLLAEEGVPLRQNEVRGGVDAIGVARSEERADRVSRMRVHVREEVGSVTGTEQLCIGQYDKFFEEYCLLLIV